jgi:uncharacterized protein YcbK (DUF882 family)
MELGIKTWKFAAPVIRAQAGNRDFAIDRRGVLRLGCAIFATLGGAPAFARTTAPARSLALANVHTGESLRATYWEHGRYLPDALAAIDHVLRDHHTDETVEMDTRLLDLLHVLRVRLGCRDSFEVLSGYRSPATNAALLEEGHGVAAHSFHTVGKAVDICLADRSVAAIRRAAMRLRSGGVGYYPSAGFVHLDVGPVRHW